MGGSSKAPATQNINQSALPEYAQPYVTDIMNRAQGAMNTDYVPYGGQRQAEFSPEQQQAQSGVMGLEAPGQFDMASAMSGASGLAALNSQYNPSNFYSRNVRPQQYGGVGDVQAPGGPNGIQASQMQSAQSGFQPDLTNFQINNPQNFGTPQAQQYMSPYFQQVLDVQKDEAVRDAKKAQLGQNLASVNQGTYGGARQLLAQTERERNLQGQLGNIQATGTQNAYENAQQQFERDRQAGLGVAGQNLQANLGVQQLGSQNAMQMAMSNLSNEQQARVNNQAAQLQMQGMSAQQALQAALANQQAGLQTQGLNAGQNMQAQLANQSSNLQAQQLGEQSRQFGGNYGLQALAQANQSAQGLGALGAQQQQSDLARLQAQMGVGQQTQQQQQSQLDQQYADFLRQRDYPLEQLGYYSNIIHGIPVGLNTTDTTYAAPASLGQQAAGLGLGALSMYNMGKGP